MRRHKLRQVPKEDTTDYRAMLIAAGVTAVIVIAILVFTDTRPGWIDGQPGWTREKAR